MDKTMINAKTLIIFIFSIVIFLLIVYTSIASPKQTLLPVNTWSEICSNTTGNYLSSQFQPPLGILTTASDWQNNTNGCSWYLQQTAFGQTPLQNIIPTGKVRVFFEARCFGVTEESGCIANIQTGSYVKKVDSSEDTRFWNLSLDDTWQQFELTMYPDYDPISQVQLFFSIYEVSLNYVSVQIDNIVIARDLPTPTIEPTATNTLTPTPTITPTEGIDCEWVDTVAETFALDNYVGETNDGFSSVTDPSYALGAPNGSNAQLTAYNAFSNFGICAFYNLSNIVSGTITMTTVHTNGTYVWEGIMYHPQQDKMTNLRMSDSDWTNMPGLGKLTWENTTPFDAEIGTIGFCAMNISAMYPYDSAYLDSSTLIVTGKVCNPIPTPTPSPTPTITPTPTTPCYDYPFFFDMNDFGIVYGNFMEGIGVQSVPDCINADCIRVYRSSLPVKDIESVTFTYANSTTKALQIQTAYTNFYSNTVSNALTNTITLNSHDDQHIITHMDTMSSSTVLKKITICGTGIPPTATPLPTPIMPTITTTVVGTPTPIPSDTPIPYNTPTYVPIPTLPATPIQFMTPIPTPLIITDSLISDFYYHFEKLTPTCYVLVPAIPGTSFVGITICFDYYSLRLIFWGIEIPVYYIFAAIGIFIVWRVFIWTV
jgi:hypothetical protein